MTFEDTFNTLRYADRAKKIKINLKKNVLSVNFHVGQYAKIVEDLKSEVTQLKQKIITLELENEALKAQVESSNSQTNEVDQINDDKDTNVFENQIKSLQSQLLSMEERQADYDDLQNRLTDFEKQAGTMCWACRAPLFMQA